MRPPVAAALVTALAAGPALSGWLAYRFAVAELDRAMALRPPVAVIDYQPITARLAQGVAAKDLEPGFATLKSHSTRLGEHGYLVLNWASLDAVPERYLVPAQLDLLPPPPTPSAPAPVAPGDRNAAALDAAEAAELIRTLTSPPAAASVP
jgi:hypothetical protein